MQSALPKGGLNDTSTVLGDPTGACVSVLRPPPIVFSSVFSAHICILKGRGRRGKGRKFLNLIFLMFPFLRCLSLLLGSTV